MAYQVFSEGNDSGWNKLHYKIEYETTRNGTNVGIRWKITATIANLYYFGYNIYANVWTKGNNYGRQIKANSPNRGSVTALFPADGGFFWFNNGYTDNAITGCRIIINSTNGGGISYDTGTDRTLYAPTGYVPSDIVSNINFNIGNNLKLFINDVTKINYTYTLSLDVKKVDGNWQNISTVTTTDKNYNWNLSQYANTLYSLLSTRNSAEIRINLTTKYGNTLIGITQKNGIIYVTNSNPDVPPCTLATIEGSSSVLNEVSIAAGLYSNGSNVFLGIKKDSLIAKNGATIKKIIVEWNNTKEYINIEDI